jgi:hypothetical protein
LKAIVGLLLYTGYKIQHHYLFRVSLRNWLWALLVVPPGAAFLRRMTWLQAILLSLLAVLLLAGIEWTRRKGYMVFEPARLDLRAAAGPRIEIDEQVPCRASGPFAVGDRHRHMVNERAWISYVRTREHIVMAHLKRTRFLLLARSLTTDVGYWYVFFYPQHVQHVETGYVVCGVRSRPGLAVRYLSQEKREQERTVYLAFDDTDSLWRVLDDLRRDATSDAFGRGREGTSESLSRDRAPTCSCQ